MPKKGILLVQLGTPDELSLKGVRRYLKTFLSDKRVVDIPPLLRYLLLYGVILPTRSPKTLAAYREIWTQDGSPLRVYSEALRSKLQKELEKTHTVALGMRYGKPLLKDALHQLKDCDDITVLPLYPQFADSTTGSTFEAVTNYLQQQQKIPNLHFIREFYQHPAFIKAYAALLKPYLKQPFDHLLLSYHGLPERHILKAGCQQVCQEACPTPGVNNAVCYRAQCFETSRLLTQALKLDASKYTTSFQSRLGKTVWIKPYTDEMLVTLAEKNIKHLLIACPAFVADCLETLEEIGMQAAETWQSLGGETLTLIPCLNTDDGWVKALKSICL